jgi:predicted small secreted protein
MKKSLITSLTAITIAALCLNGCNTFSGLGKDLQAGGKAITNAANDSSSHKSTTTTKTSTTVGTPTTTTTTQ